MRLAWVRSDSRSVISPLRPIRVVAVLDIEVPSGRDLHLDSPATALDRHQPAVSQKRTPNATHSRPTHRVPHRPRAGREVPAADRSKETTDAWAQPTPGTGGLQ